MFGGLINIVHLRAFLIFFGFLIVARIFVFVYEKYLLEFVEKTEGNFDDILIKNLRKPVFFALIFLGAYVAISTLDVSENFLSVIKNVLLSVFIIFFVYFGVKLVDFLIDIWLKKFVEKSETKLDDVVLPLGHKAVSLFFVIIALLLILNLWGIKVGPLLASLGIVGLAIGFALKDSLANIFGGVSIIADRSFKIGDFVKLDTDLGKVIDIGLRTTKIKTIDNQVIIIPNGDLSNSRIVNYAKPNLATRIVVPVRVAYGSNVDKIKKILLKCVDKLDKDILDEKKAKVYFIEMGDFALKFKLIVPIKDYKKKFKNAEILRTEVYKALNRNKIEIPFPTYKIRR